MKLLRRDQQNTMFSLSKRQKRQFLEVLSLYPRVPAGHYKINRHGMPGVEENQALLDEALAEQRAENQKNLREFLASPERFPTGSPATMCIPNESFEWLLQVLNDIRVGSWIAVGSPEGSLLSVLSAKTAADIWAMEVAGYFETCLLEAITGESLTGLV